MDSIAIRVEDGGNIKRDVGRDKEGIIFRDVNILRIGAIAMDSDSNSTRTEMSTARDAVSAVDVLN